MDDNHDIMCKYGKVADVWIGSNDPGIVTGMGPVLIVGADFARDRTNLGQFDVDYEVKMDAETGILTATTKALNGKWVHVLEHAHWRDGHAPDWRFVHDIMIGRYPD